MPFPLPNSAARFPGPPRLPRMRPARSALGVTSGLVAGLQQAGAVPLRRRLVSRVLPGSGLRNISGSASLQRHRERRRPRRSARLFHTRRPLLGAGGSLFLEASWATAQE